MGLLAEAMMSAYKDRREHPVSNYHQPRNVDTTAPTIIRMADPAQLDVGRTVTEREFHDALQGRKLARSWHTIVDPPCMRFHDAETGQWIGTDIWNYYPDDPHEYRLNAALYPPHSTGGG